MDLEDDINNVVKMGAKPWEVHDFVPVKPIINTAKDKTVIGYGSFAPDPDHPDEFVQIEKYNHCVYWKLSDEKDYTSIIGIVWDANMRSKKFYAVVLPPE